MAKLHTITKLAALFLLCATGAMSQGVRGVHPDLSSPVQIGVSYTFVRFYEVPTPSTEINSNGFNVSAVYYRDWVGAEGAVSDVFGSTNGKNSQLLFTGGGIRLRWPDSRSLQPWIHGLLGYSHLTPKTPYGSESALGYKVGAGVDFNPHHRRLALRASVDLSGNHFFQTYQLSPEASVGVVFLLGGS